MPRVWFRSVADRSQGSNTDTWPRLNEDGSADVILQPEDILEGAGNLSDIGQDGQPDKTFRLVAPPQSEVRNFYAGSRPDTATRQNPSPIPVEHSSYPMNHPLVDGDLLPGAGEPLAPLPRPGIPKIVIEPAASGGFPVATASKPHWIAFGYEENGRLSDPGPATSFTGGQGQSYRVTLPEDVPETITGLVIWMAEPGTSTSTAPGPMRIQALISRRDYFAPTYDLNGPFRYEREEGADETGVLKKPLFQLVADGRSRCNPGEQYAAVSAVLRAGTENPSAPSASQGQYTALSPATILIVPATVEMDNHDYGDGKLRIVRPPLPPEAVGWMAAWYLPDHAWRGWMLLQRSGDGVGGLFAPIPVDTKYIDFDGLILNYGERKFTFGNTTLFANDLPPTLKILAPDSAPEIPLAFNSARLTPGKWHGRVTEESNGLESPASLPVEFEVGENDIPRVVFDNPKNRIPNATFKEKDASGLPLGYTIVQTGGVPPRVEGGELLLQTDGVQAGTTPSALTATADVDPTEQWTVSFSLKMEYPPRGALAGSIEAVLREIDSSGSTTDTVLATLSSPGERIGREKILATGSVGDYVWQSDTVEARLYYRFSGASKNALMRISQQSLKGYGWFFRRRRRAAGALATTNIPPEITIPPGTDVALEPPPSVSLPPPGETLENPDRYISSGTTLESGGFESGAPSGWISVTSGSGGITYTAGAALTGSQGMRLLKSSGGALSSAYLGKTFVPPAGLSDRHDTGCFTRYRVQSLSDTHYLDLHGVARPLDGARFAWIRYAKALETAQLTIESSPTDPGSVTLNLNGTNTDVAVVATKEVATLALTGTPSAVGAVKVTLDDVVYQVPVGGTREEFTLSVDTLAQTTGRVQLTIDGLAKGISVGAYKAGATTWTREFIAQRIAQESWPGWSQSVSGRIITFRADLPGPRTDPVFTGASTNLQASIYMVTQGAVEVASALATRIKEILNVAGTGWTAAQGATASDVIFTAVQAGPKANASYDPGTTGATGTMTTNTEGALDSPTSLAATIRGTSFAGCTTGGSGAVVTLTATSSGVRQDSLFDPNSTGVLATMETLVQGSTGDVSAIVKDSSGVEQFRKILFGIGTSIYNIDIGVSGAGTENGIVNFFVSTGTDPKALKMRFENVDLTDYPAGKPQVGVVGESSASATWEVHADDYKITDRGETHFEDHDYAGNLLNQAYYHGVPDQPILNNVFFQPGEDGRGGRIAVIPGTQIKLAARARWDGAAEGTSPLRVIAVSNSGLEEDLGDILGGLDGISGTEDWNDWPLQIIVPDSGDPGDNYYELRISSRNMSAGEIVIQQIAASLGTIVKRTNLYATSGTHRATLSIVTPQMWHSVLFGRQRSLLKATLDEPSGTTIDATYRYGVRNADETVTWNPTWEMDPADVADYQDLQVEVEMTGDGVTTPALKAFSPVADYRLKIGPRDLGTFLKWDATELPGGAFFESFEEWEDLTDIIIHDKPGGDFSRTSIYPSVRRLPEFTILLFTPEARRYIAAKWGLEKFVIEDEETALTVKLRGLVAKKRMARRTINGQTYSVYEAKVPAGSVVEEVQALP